MQGSPLVGQQQPLPLLGSLDGRLSLLPSRFGGGRLTGFGQPDHTGIAGVSVSWKRFSESNYS
jgi:hypothetical protein